MRALANPLALGILCLLWATSSWAYYLDAGRNFDVRFRGYSQVSVSAEQSRDGSPRFTPGDVMGQRNFYAPEFDAKLTPFIPWSLADDFKFRFAWWGFYDGIFDYGAPQWNQARNGILTGADRANYAKISRISGAGFDPSLGPMARQSQSENPRRESYRFADEARNLNGILRHRNRINEMYLDYTKGRFFVRAGRQAISWGESDSIAQMDISNPFELTQTAPGFFQDVDEARIPLWTLRSTVKLIDAWGELSSLFLDTYLVPGIIDTTVPITPSWFGMPGSAAGFDPQLQISNGQVVNGVVPLQSQLPLHVSIVDQLPKNTWGNSRWGARLTAVLFRDYTVQGWFFRTFNEQPSPQITGPSAILHPEGLTLIDNRGNRVASCVRADGSPVSKAGIGLTAFGHTPGGRACNYAAPIVTVLHHKLESVAGLSATWFSQPVNGIIRTEVEFMHDEVSVIPSLNLNPGIQVPGSGVTTSVPKADYLRFIIGYDTFFFARWLNESNSFTFVSGYQGQFNTSAMNHKDFRNPGQKPGESAACAGPGDPYPSCIGQGTAPPDRTYEDQYFYEGFFQLHLETSYMHGRLNPGVTAILDPSGIFGFAPAVNYRINDNLIASASFLAVEGSRRTGLATFRDRDQFQFRMTYQLN